LRSETKMKMMQKNTQQLFAFVLLLALVASFGSQAIRFPQTPTNSIPGTAHPLMMRVPHHHHRPMSFAAIHERSLRHAAEYLAKRKDNEDDDDDDDDDGEGEKGEDERKMTKDVKEAVEAAEAEKAAGAEEKKSDEVKEEGEKKEVEGEKKEVHPLWKAESEKKEEAEEAKKEEEYKKMIAEEEGLAAAEEKKEEKKEEEKKEEKKEEEKKEEKKEEEADEEEADDGDLEKKEDIWRGKENLTPDEQKIYEKYNKLENKAASLEDAMDSMEPEKWEARIDARTHLVGEETQAKHLATMLGNMWREMHEFAAPFYKDYLKMKLEKVEKKQAKLERKLLRLRGHDVPKKEEAEEKKEEEKKEEEKKEEKKKKPKGSPGLSLVLVLISLVGLVGIGYVFYHYS